MKTIKFSKSFLGCAIFSAVVIVFGIIGLFVRGINFGIDFVPGLVEEVKIAPESMEISYSGNAAATIETSNTAITVVVSGVGAENESFEFTYGKYPTVSAMAAAIDSVKGVSVKVLANQDADSYGIYSNSAVSSRLSSETPYFLYVNDADSTITTNDVRDSLKDLNVQVKELGSEGDRSFQIRSAIKDDSLSSTELQNQINDALQNTFGKNNVAIIKTDFVGSSFSSSLVGKSVLLAVLTIALIWVYVTFRFHWDFALGSIIALLHDCLIMFTIISWTQIEFSTTTLAAVLTIFGYSINATVVILDRVRANMKIMSDAKSFNEILDASITQTLSRSIITTVTTMFASVSLWIFTTGSIRTFAIVLTAGLISGCYSSMFISSGFISFVRKNWDPSTPNKIGPKKAKKEIKAAKKDA